MTLSMLLNYFGPRIEIFKHFLTLLEANGCYGSIRAIRSFRRPHGWKISKFQIWPNLAYPFLYIWKINILMFFFDFLQQFRPKWIFYIIIRLLCKNKRIPRRNCGHFGGINSPRAQSSDQFRGARVENIGSYFLWKSALIISGNSPRARVTETPELSQARIPSHPGIKYRVRTSPHFDISLVWRISAPSNP